jgi:hypothetical protein
MGYPEPVMFTPLIAALRRVAPMSYRPMRTGGALALAWTSRKPALQFHD